MTDYYLRKEAWGHVLFRKSCRNYQFFYTDEKLNAYLAAHQIEDNDLEFRGTYMPGSSQPLSAPLAAYLEISPRCTLRCRHCFKPANQIYSHTLSVDDMDGIIEELYHMGVFEVRLVGYEACTSPHFEHILEHIRRRGFYTVLTTSAYYSENMQRDVVNKQFDEYLVSLEGLRETHDLIRGEGAFDRVLSFVEMAKDRSRVRLNVTVSRSNMEQIEGMAQLASQLGVSIGFAPFRNIGVGRTNHWIGELTAEDMRRIQNIVVEARKKFPKTKIILAYHDLYNDSDLYHPLAFSVPCLSRHNISILNNGQVFHCDFLAYIGDKYCGGNVLESSVREIWNGDFIKRYENLQINPNCPQCKYYMKKCSGGCASEVLETQNLFFDPLCTQHSTVYSISNDSFYDEDYYKRGPDSGKSNYVDYHWIPEYSYAQQKALVKLLSLSKTDVLVDFGAAMGYLMRAFNDNDYTMYGVDCSNYAVSKCEKYHDKLFCSDSLKALPIRTANWVISINTLEHLSINQLLRFFQETAVLQAALFYVVPISEYDGGKYIAQKANKDTSHTLRRTKTWWKTVTEKYFSKVTVIPANSMFEECDSGLICVKAVL